MDIPRGHQGEGGVLWSFVKISWGDAVTNRVTHLVLSRRERSFNVVHAPEALGIPPRSSSPFNSPGICALRARHKTGTGVVIEKPPPSRFLRARFPVFLAVIRTYRTTFLHSPVDILLW